MTDLEQLLAGSIKIRELEQHVERLKTAINKLLEPAYERISDLHMAADFFEDHEARIQADRWVEACILCDLALYAEPPVTEPRKARLLSMQSGRTQ